MNILMLCEFYSPNVEFQENLLAKYYVRNGHAVTVVTSTFESIFDYYGDRYDKTKPASEFVDRGARIIRLPYRYNLLNRLRAYTKIGRLLTEARPDLIYVHDIMPNLPEVISYKKANPHCRVILDYHADYSNSGKNALSLKVLHGVLRKYFLDMARPHLSRIFPVVPASAVFLHEVYGVPHDEMEVLPLGADMEVVRRVQGEGCRDAIRERLGLGRSDTVIFTGGKLMAGRRTELLFDAVAKLNRNDLKIIVIGDADAHNTSYKELLHSLAASRDDIRFAGWLGPEDIYRHMAAADLAVFPASQSILWQQSIAMGLPLIAGDIGWQDISYLNFEDNIIVLRGKEISGDGIAAAIHGVISDQRRLEIMSSGARRVAEEHLDWDKLIARTLRYNVGAEGSNA